MKAWATKARVFHLSYGLWLFSVFAFFLPAATWNPVSRFNLTRAIVERGTLSIDAYADSTGDRSRVRGRWYTDKTPIPSLLAVPAYAVMSTFFRLQGRAPTYTAVGTDELPARRVAVNRAYQRALWVCTISTVGLAGVALGLMLFQLLRRRTHRRRALLLSALTMLGTPLLPYSTSLYGHVVAGAFLLAAVMALDQSNSATGEPPSPARLRLAGACLALAPGCEYLTAVPAALGGLFILAWVGSGRRLAAMRDLLIGGAVPILVVSGYHTACFGAPWKTGYSFIARPEFAAGHASGLLGLHPPRFESTIGLLFGAQRGLFYVAPITAVGTIGLVAAAVVQRDRTAQLGLGMLASMLVLNAGYYMWWGGAATGPRHLVPVVGFTAIGLVQAWRLPWLRTPCLVAGLVSVANATVLTAVGLEAPESGDVLFDYAWPQLLAGRIAHLSGASNLGLELGLPPRGSLLPLLGWMVVGFVHLQRQTRSSPQRSRRRPHHSWG